MPYRLAAGACVLLSILLIASLAGCGGGALARLHGKVTLDGKALDRGNVTFHPVKGGQLGAGKIQPDGTYRVETAGTPGLAPGEYRVTVVATGDMPKATPQNPEPLPELLTPAKYGRPETSGFHCIVPTRDGSYDISLQK